MKETTEEIDQRGEQTNLSRIPSDLQGGGAGPLTARVCVEAALLTGETRQPPPSRRSRSC